MIEIIILVIILSFCSGTWEAMMEVTLFVIALLVGGQHYEGAQRTSRRRLPVRPFAEGDRSGADPVEIYVPGLELRTPR